MRSMHFPNFPRHWQDMTKLVEFRVFLIRDWLAKESKLLNTLPEAGWGWGRTDRFMPFAKVSAQNGIQKASSRIWTQGPDSISYDDNHYVKPATSSTPLPRSGYDIMSTFKRSTAVLTLESFLLTGCRTNVKRILSALLFTHTSIHTFPKGINTVYLPNERAGCNMRSIFRRSLTGLNSEFSFSEIGCQLRLKCPVCPTTWRENGWVHTFPESVCTMWSVNSRSHFLQR